MHAIPNIVPIVKYDAPETIVCKYTQLGVVAEPELISLDITFKGAPHRMNNCALNYHVTYQQ